MRWELLYFYLTPHISVYVCVVPCRKRSVRGAGGAKQAQNFTLKFEDQMTTGRNTIKALYEVVRGHVEREEVRHFLSALRKAGGTKDALDDVLSNLEAYADKALDEETDEKLLEYGGWVVGCRSPLEIRHKDGSFATGRAAKAVIFGLRYG